MNDIVERLRRIEYEWNTNTTCREAATEIEWLREEIRLHVSVKDKLKDEIARLHADRDMTMDGLKSIVATQAEEIERLRGEHQEYVATAMALQNAVAEIAHLRQLLAQAVLWHRQFPISEVTHDE